MKTEVEVHYSRKECKSAPVLSRHLEPVKLEPVGGCPPTGTIHPRESRGTTNEKQIKRVTSADAFQNLELREDI